MGKKRPGPRKEVQRKKIAVFRNSASFLTLHVPFLFLASFRSELDIFRTAIPVF